MSDATTLLEGILEEKLFTKSKMDFYWEELPIIIEALKKAQKFVKKYKEAAKKLDKDDDNIDNIDDVVIEVQIVSDSLLRNILDTRKEKKQGKSKGFAFSGEVIVIDANGVVPGLLNSDYRIATIPYKGHTPN